MDKSFNLQPDKERKRNSMMRAPLFLAAVALILLLVVGYAFFDLKDVLVGDNPFAGLENLEEPVSLEGEVATDPAYSDDISRFTCKVTSLQGEKLTEPVKIAVLSEEENIAYGDSVTLTGSFMESKVLNPGGFDYSSYQENNSLYGTFSAMYGGSTEITASVGGNFLMKAAYWLKHRFLRALSALPDSQQLLIKGVFFGDTSAMDINTSDVLSKSGIRHCFAVSGLHVGYILLLLNFICGLFKLGKKGKLAVILPCLFFYAAITGFSPSVMRASLMCTMVLFSGLTGREQNSFNALGASVIILLLINPLMLLQSGFILSFTAMFSILFFMPWLERCVTVKFPGKDALLVTLAAQIGVTPVLAYLFHVVSIVSLLISGVCCLLIGGVVLLCFCALIMAIFWPLLATVILIPAGILGELVLKGASLCLKLPGAYVYRGAFGVGLMLLIYALIIFIVLLPALRKRKILPLLLVTGVFAAFLLPTAAEKDKLEIDFLSVGEGDACYIHTPGGRDIMIDAGDPKEGSVSYYTIRPFLLYKGVTELDGVILSHNDDDHSGALPYLAQNFNIRNYVVSAADRHSFGNIKKYINTYGGELITASAGDTIDLGEGCEAHILWPETHSRGESNELSLTLMLNYEDLNILFCGDLEGKGLDYLKENCGNELKADIIKLPHHGSKNSYDEEFYRLVDPDIAVISVGKNGYGHPSSEVTAYMDRHYIKCLRTDESGAVTIRKTGGVKGFDTETFIAE